MSSEQPQPPGVVVLYNRSDNLVKGDARDLIADQGVIKCAETIAAALQSRGQRTALAPIWAEPPLLSDESPGSGPPRRRLNGRTCDVELALAAYPPAEWVVFNLGEGLEGRLFEEVRIAWVLESMGYRFTGNDAEALGRSTNKVRAKLALAERGVPTPAWLAFQHPNQVDESVAGCLPFPAIVKPVAEDASQGIGPDAVVYNLRGLRERVAYVVETYRQVALAEAFVVGREFNVSLWGDPVKVLPLSEIDFSRFSDPYARIVSFSAKWEEESFEYRNMPVLCPAPVDRELGTRITRTARQAWAAMGCRGYARVDMRVSPDGTPYVVEVNCNPDLSPDAGFFTASRTAGYSYEDMVGAIVQLAPRRRTATDRTVARKGWAMQSRPARSGQRLPAVQPQLWPAGMQPAALPGGNGTRARR